jgi:hypothetical protein
MTAMPDYYTTRQAAELLCRPEWLIRRVVDRLQTPVPRFGGKRAIPALRLAEIAEAIRQREIRREAAHA